MAVQMGEAQTRSERGANLSGVQGSLSEPRLAPLDALRGLIMVLMAIDHANFFVAHAHTRGEFWDLPLPRYDDSLTFLTRFLTHFSAPGFFFLMGAGMALFTASRRKLGWTPGAITRHLLVRGGLLIALQLLVENRAWPLGLPPGAPDLFSLYFGVLYGLGISMIMVALLSRLGPFVLGAACLAAVIGAQALLPGPIDDLNVNPLFRLVLVAGGSGNFAVYYPLVPWFGVTGLGMLFGLFLLRDRAAAYRGALGAGAALLVLFFILRASGGYGNIHPAEGAGWIDFLNLTKYPPGLTFLLLTLGVDLLVLGLLAALSGPVRLERWAFPLLVFGRVPLFFYIAHLFLFALIGIVLAPEGTTIPGMYPFWLLGLLVLFPLCWGYLQFKQSRPPGSIWRFF